MDESTAQEIQEEASEHYNGGRYREAIRLWEEVLRLDPGNQKARDGIQMASLLVDQFSGASAPQPDGSDLDDTAPVVQEARIQAGISRVRELLAGGSVDEALEGCSLLEGIAPGLEEVRQLVLEVKAAAESPAPATTAEVSGLESLLAEARQALEEGRNEDAAAAAMRAARVDPGNAEACGIISLVGVSEAVGEEEPSDHLETPPIPDLDLDGAPTQAISAATIPELSIPSIVESSGPPPDRIAALIQEGQAAFGAGRLEAAIEAWSRVFAIDQANAEAGPLIDRAKEALEIRARELDEMLYSATDAREQGRTEEATEICNQMLQRNPDHLEALALLDELRSDQASPDPEGEFTIDIDRRAIDEAAAEKEKQAEREKLFNESVPLATSPEAIASAERSSRMEDRPVPPPVSATRSGGGRRLAVALVVITLAAGAGWYMFFGNRSGSGPRVQMMPQPAFPPQQPPGSPAPSNHSTQQNASLQVLPATPTPEIPPEPTPDRETQDTRSKARDLEKQGRRRFADGDWTAAVLALREARQLDPVHFNSEPMLDEAMDRLETEARLERQVHKAIQSFNDRDYASALYSFYRLQEGDEKGRRYDGHIRDSWFNWGVILLREGSVDEAREKFVEARDVAPADPAAARAIEMIDRYESRIVDEAFDSFVASLKLRTLE